MARQRALVVGAGGISGLWFASLRDEKVPVVGVVDLKRRNAERRIQEFELECEAWTDLPAALKATRPDFVVDVTVPEAHCYVTCTAMKAGCHVIGEKPMASSMVEARRMVRTAERTGKLYMVSQTRRWHPKHDMVCRTVAAGRIGPVGLVNCDYYMSRNFGGFRLEMPCPLIVDMAIHHFDMARFMVGVDPVAVYAKEFNPRWSWFKGDAAASCIFEMTGGVIFSYNASWCAEGCETPWAGNWRIVGRKGTLIYEDEQDPRGEVRVGRGVGSPLKKLKPLRSPLRHATWRGALREMLAYLRTGKRPQCECHDNIKSLAMVYTAVESAAKARRILLKGQIP